MPDKDEMYEICVSAATNGNDSAGFQAFHRFKAAYLQGTVAAEERAMRWAAAAAALRCSAKSMALRRISSRAEAGRGRRRW